MVDPENSERGGRKIFGNSATSLHTPRGGGGVLRYITDRDV